MNETQPSAVAPLIRRLEVKHFGCLQDVNLELTPLHALIGPNDSGKSTVLRALRTAFRLAGGNFQDPAPDQRVLPYLRGDGRRDSSSFLLELGTGGISFVALWRGQDIRCQFLLDRSVLDSWTIGLGTKSDVPTAFTTHERGRSVADLLTRGEELLRLDPDSLRSSTQLIPDGEELLVFGNRGRGLAGVIDAIQNSGGDRFRRIQDDLTRLFPTVKHLRLKNVNQASKALRIELKTGELVDSDCMSEGMLYFLAFAALQHISPPALLLIEEPENGLHPARIRDVVRVLRELSKTTQIVLATHSPLVINELEAQEVTVLTRDGDKGTIATRLDRTPNFKERAKIYALGELWVSYADGNREAPLLEPKSGS